MFAGKMRRIFARKIYPTPALPRKDKQTLNGILNHLEIEVTCVQGDSLSMPITNIEPCDQREFNVIGKRCVREPRGIIRAKDWFDGPDVDRLGFLRDACEPSRAATLIHPSRF